MQSAQFKSVLNHSTIQSINNLQFYYSESLNPKIGFIVSRKYGNAVKRNLFKRRCRHAFYKLKNNGLTYSIIIQPMTSRIKWTTINEAFNELYNQFTN